MEYFSKSIEFVALSQNFSKFIVMVFLDYMFVHFKAHIIDLIYQKKNFFRAFEASFIKTLIAPLL